MGLDVAIIIACLVMLLLLWAAVARPNGPDPENPEEAPQALGEGMAGLFGVILLVIVIFAAVFLL